MKLEPALKLHIFFGIVGWLLFFGIVVAFILLIQAQCRTIDKQREAIHHLNEAHRELRRVLNQPQPHPQP